MKPQNKKPDLRKKLQFPSEVKSNPSSLKRHPVQPELRKKAPYFKPNKVMDGFLDD